MEKWVCKATNLDCIKCNIGCEHRKFEVALYSCPACGGNLDCESPMGGKWTCDTCEYETYD